MSRWAAILPGIVAPNLPSHFATFAAYLDLATGVLAMLALLGARIRPLFWLLVVAFNLVGIADLIIDYYHALQLGLPGLAGQLGATMRSRSLRADLAKPAEDFTISGR